ncbi:DNA glycosylase [Prauserella marina]|uniref:DNA-(apurinic or apyrimidinic site) lyase n=1 Tax=Prauserella marina TaxID=530584 RepID=A0A222VNS4_9PSEU|nr:DNA-formamidopyrimidine glycosylase family protein [Prauserella marina]ASR35371.1 DNA glycosylase [Prauserella marina]PWV84832.1 endonuclease-8 [Prauserella marina]SDC11971.1 endonuclease-8 [Prauserella marina]
MPEGDVVFLTGVTMSRALAGTRLTRSDFRHPALATTDLTGREVLGVRTVGKHLFTRFSGELSLHSHLKMDGSWRVFAPGARWTLPGHHARVVLANREAEVVGFRVHDLALLPTGEESRFVGHLGPDLLDPQWSDEHAREAASALAAVPSRELGLALLDQRVMAGIGNLYKVEICFLLGVTPWSPVTAIDPAEAVALARKLLLANARRHEQSTTGQLTRGRRNWVYERTRAGCFRCGGPVRVVSQGEGTHARPTWYCPACQRGPAPQR